MSDVVGTPFPESSETEIAPECSGGNEFDGRLGLRVAALFVILVGSTLGAILPILARRHAKRLVSKTAFFVVKFFGSGVIIATAFIHLLAPAHEALSNPCLTGPITEYPWVEGISLITIFVMCFLQLMTMHYVGLRNASQPSDSSGSDVRPSNPNDLETSQGRTGQPEAVTSDKHPHDLPVPKKDSDKLDGQGLDTFAVQLTSVFVLEFGVIFHSVLIGLTLAVAGEEFKILFIVLVFHQTFEGLGIGSRLATIPWPESRKWTPLILGLAYGLSTPVAIGIGLGVRNVYPPESRTALIVSGVFDSISAGILIYASLVELIAHEIVFSDMMRRTSPNRALRAFSLVCLGAGLMALLGRWA